MKPFLIFVFYFAVQWMHAQDTIVRRDGNKIIAKVTEVNPNDIKYKRFDFMEGPLYTLPKEQIKLVIYSNGSRESFQEYIPPLSPLPVMNLPLHPDLSMTSSGWKYFYKERRITEPDMLAVAGKLGDKKINLAIKRTEEKKFIQDATLIAGFLAMVSGSLIYAANRPVRGRTRGGSNPNTYARANARVNGGYIMLGGAGCELVSIGFRFDRKRYAHVVKDLYNNAIGK